jgi:hypothetical protein
MDTTKHLRDFINNETKNKGKLPELFYTAPEVKATWELAYFFNNKPLKPVTEIKPSLVLRFLRSGMTLLFASVAIIITVVLLFVDLVFAFGAILMCALVYKTLIKPLFSKDVYYSISMDADGLICSNNRYRWEDIIETYIMKKQGGRVMYSYLLLETASKEVIKFDLEAFTISNRDLATLIEGYKKIRSSDKPLL